MPTIARTEVTHDGFAAVYAEHADRLARLAWLLTGDAHLAEDVVADAFVQVWRRWQHGGIADPGAYLRTTVVNTVRSGFRRRYLEARRAATRSGDGRGGLAHDDRAAGRDAMWRAVQQLPQRQREVVVLRFWEDLDVATTAAVLGIGEGAVKTHTHRATARLAELLEGQR